VLRLKYRLNRKVNPESDLMQLLTGLTREELQAIRKNWDFKGISHLNKKELVKELYGRIPLSVHQWMKLITSSVYEFLKELVSHEGHIYIDIRSEQDLSVLKYLQERGVVFYGKYRGEVLLVMPEEIKKELQHIIGLKPESKLFEKIEQNTELVLLTIGFLVYYGVYSIIKLPDEIQKYLDFELDPLDYFTVIHELMKAYDIIDYHYNSSVALKYVMEPEWVLEEQHKRSQLEFYQMNRNELVYAGKNLLPPLNNEYKELADYLRENNINNDRLDEIITRLYLDINNNLSFPQVVSRIAETLDFNTINQIEELNEYILAVYNNTRQWVLKGNTPAEVKSIDIDTNYNDIKNNNVKNNVVNITEFQKYKEDNKGTIRKAKDVGRNDPCPCGSGKKYKKCCMKEDQRKELLRSKLEEGGKIEDTHLSRFEYVEEFGYPVLMFDYFLLEVANIAGYVLDAYNRYGNINKVNINKLLRELIQKGRKFYNNCQNCENKCLDNPFKPVSLDKYRQMGVNIDSFPFELQRETALNYFYFELLHSLLDVLYTGILAEGNSEEITKEIYQMVGDHIIGLIAGSCYGECGNRCITNHQANAYCDFCIFSSPAFPCPRKGEISYEEIQASEEDMLH
jgi:hypothetical protein